MKIDVIIPVYRPGTRFLEMLRRLTKQTRPVNRFIIMNTEEDLWEDWVKTLPEDALPENLSVFHVTKEEFDHGATRHAGVMESDAEIFVCMTHDAMPADKKLIEKLADALTGEDYIGAAYARQLPEKDCHIIERYTRRFNYPEESRVKVAADLPELGIKTYFCSNVCAAYKRDLYLELGGFTKKTIFNEDMIYAAKLIKNGYGVAYAADARVIHSHNYTGIQQFCRNFDLAVSQADHPEVFEGIRSEGEGVKLVKKTAGYLVKHGKIHLVPQLIYVSGCKYLGYLAGKRYKKLPYFVILQCTMNKNYWKG